jgi:glutathione synthase
VSRRRLAVIMDPIRSITPYKDSTLALLLAAQARGWEIHCAGLGDIWIRDCEAFGRLTQLQVADDPAMWFELGDVSVTPLGDLDAILMRKDPPFDMEYITATYVLERAEERGAVVVNRPRALRDANEQAIVAWFPNCVPPTLITRSLEEIRGIITEHHKVVVKPLDLMGRQSVYVTDAKDGNRNVILETVSHTGTRFTMLQKYLPEILDSGDKRIILIDGKPVPMALVRIPGPGDHHGNLAAGACAEVHPLTDRDLWICDQVGPELRDRGLLFAGIDDIGDSMTEVNVTSPTGIRELERMSDVRIADQILDAVASRLG